MPVLRAAGFTDIIVEPEQMIPDGNFPTIENGKPNPEEKAANDRAALKIMGANAHALAREKFDRKILAKQFVAWLTSAK